MHKLSLDEVKAFVKSNSDCELISGHYEGMHSPLKFRCKCGNEFTASFSNFKFQNKRQCNECGRAINNQGQHRLTIEFIKSYVEQNSNCKLLSTEYKNSRIKLKFECHCGNEFETTFGNFKNGKKQCNKCGHIINISKQRLTLEEIKYKVELISDCKLLSKNYKNNQQKLKFQCGCGNIFETDLATFIYYNKRQCDNCSKKERSSKTRYSKTSLADYVKNNSNCELLDVQHITRNGKTICRLKLKCNCGEIFYTDKCDFDHYNKRRCDKCSHSQSRFECLTESYLKDNNIEFIRQKTFNGCKYKQSLFFDFYLPQYNTCIEVDGQFHFKETALGNDFSNQIKRDKVKDNFCKQNNIKLIRIPYWDIENIDNILKNALS
jgi:very-short-patch-repair endonuclease